MEGLDSAVTVTSSPPQPVPELSRQPGSDAVATTTGPVGLLRVSSAEVGAPNQLRFGFAGEFFSTSNFIIDRDQDLRLLGSLAVGFTPLRFLEVFGSISGSANRNRRLMCTTGTGGTVCGPEPGRNDPEVIKSYGDMTLGSKFAYPLSGGVSAGGEIGLRFLSSINGISFLPKATSVWLSGLGTWDLRALGAPLRAHLNLGLYFDNSGKVQDYSRVSRSSQAVSQFAYGIGKDRVRTGLGFEWLIDVSPSFGLRPFAEYHLEVITAGADPVFNDYRPPLCRDSNMSMSGPPCRDNRDQQWATFGLRGQLRSGFSIGAGTDVALHSLGFPYGSPLAPWNLVLMLAYPIDLSTPKLVTRTVTVEKRVPVEKKAPEGTVLGKVVTAAGGAPIEGALVSVPGRTKSRVATDPDGTFRTAGLPPGAAELEVAAANFEPNKVRAVVVAGQEAAVTVVLTPRVQKAKVSGRVTDDGGKPVRAATVRFAGPQNAEVKTDDTGAFTTSLTGGEYVVRVEADRFVAKETKVSLADGKDQDLSTAIHQRPIVTRVVIGKSRLSIRQPVSFKGTGPAATEISPTAASLLDEVADTLSTHPELKHVRIEAHWDASLPRDKAQELTDQQARAVATYLAKQGVGESRLEAVGMGAQRPLVPNIGTAKLRNRRVEFRIVN
jgi:outer membrane protein OmpA-like peptidoglycan-associated protein